MKPSIAENKGEIAVKTYIFTYRSYPNIWRSKAITRRFRNVAQAERFATGLRLGGAQDVKYSTSN